MASCKEMRTGENSVHTIVTGNFLAPLRLFCKTNKWEGLAHFALSDGLGGMILLSYELQRGHFESRLSKWGCTLYLLQMCLSFPPNLFTLLLVYAFTSENIFLSIVGSKCKMRECEHEVEMREC